MEIIDTSAVKHCRSIGPLMAVPMTFGEHDSFDALTKGLSLCKGWELNTTPGMSMRTPNGRLLFWLSMDDYFNEFEEVKE